MSKCDLAWTTAGLTALVSVCLAAAAAWLLITQPVTIVAWLLKFL